MNNITCWCGNTDFEDFSLEYSVCSKCGTLVRTKRREIEFSADGENGIGFYGQDYWLKHQTEELDDPDLLTRSRDDLTERILYWLKYILKYCLPPARSLELGCSHGGFVALLRQAGFDSYGLELSPWVVDFAQKQFNIPMYSGLIEDQDIEPESLDLIIMMDVLEHLPDPKSTIKHCVHLLKPDGKLIIQTPEFKPGMAYTELVQEDSLFLKLLKPVEHLYLFSQDSLISLISSSGLENHLFLPPCFPYDMFIVASRELIIENPANTIEEQLFSSAAGRIVLALLDLRGMFIDIKAEYKEIEADRQARLDNIIKLDNLYKESEIDRESRLKLIHRLEKDLLRSEQDRSERLKVIQKQDDQIKRLNDERMKLEERLQESETDRAKRYDVIQTLEKQIKDVIQDRLKLESLLQESEDDRAARLEIIQELEKKLEISEADRNARLKTIQTLEKKLEESDADRTERLILMKKLDDQLRQSEVDRSARLDLINQLDSKMKELEADHQERLKVIENLDKRLQDSEEESSAQFKLIESHNKQLEDLEKEKRYLIENLEQRSLKISRLLDQIQSLEDELSWGPIQLLRSFRRRIDRQDNLG